MSYQQAREILSYLEENQVGMLDFLKDLVTMESPSRDADSQKPVLHKIAQELECLEYLTCEYPGYRTGGFLYARPKKRNRSKGLQLLLGHSDTVWEKNSLDKMPVVSRSGTLSGPGVYDMKAGLTQMVFALKALEELNLRTELTPVILINSDEEIGSVESGKIIKRLAMLSDRAFVLEPPLGLEGKLKTRRKGIGRFTVTVQGRAAHAGLDPGKGINAIVELSHLVQELYAMNDFEKGISVNVGTIEGGISPNVVAPMSKAVIDVRVSTVADGAYITEKIHKLKPHSGDVVLKIEGGIGRPPMEKTYRNQKLWELARIQAGYLGLELEEGMAGGGSDGNTTSLFTATLDGLGTTGDGAHALHEHIFTSHLPQRTALLTMLLLASNHQKK